MHYIILPQDFDWANLSDFYENSVLEIRHLYNMENQSITFPKDVTLKFTGGRFTNYRSITGSNTKIIADLTQIFDPLDSGINGTWDVIEAYPQWFGAKGDGDNDDTQSIQSTINLSLSVCFPAPQKAYRVTSPLILRGGQTIIGSSKSDGLSRTNDLSRNVKGIWGDMTTNGTEIFQLGDGEDSKKRKMTFYNIFAYNNNGPVIKSRYCSEFSFFGCELRSRFYHCIDTRQSYLFGFYNCSIGSSGRMNNQNIGEMAVAAYLMDNSNGVLFSNCRISGGSVGGVARIGKSYNLKFDGCVFEATKFGIYVADQETNTGVSGMVHTMTIIDCQWEQCYQPLSIGLNFACLGLRIEGIYISNSNKNIIPERDTAIRLGRVEGALIKNVIFDLSEDEFAWEFVYEPLAEYYLTLKNSDISNIIYKSVSPNNGWKTSGFLNEALHSRLSKNRIQLLDEQIGEISEYISPEISCIEGTNGSSRQISSLGSFGGQLLKVEILDATDSLSGNLRIGYPQGKAEYLDYDLSTTTVTHGYSLILNSHSGINLRAGNPLLFGVIGGQNEGTFRLKITYK